MDRLGAQPGVCHVKALFAVGWIGASLAATLGIGFYQTMQVLDELREAQPVAIFAGCTAHIPQRMYDRTAQQFTGCPDGSEYWIIKIPNKEKNDGLQAYAGRQRRP